MARLLKRLNIILHRLRWKLALSYMTVTVGTLLVAVCFVAIFLFRSILIPNNFLTRDLWFDAANRELVPWLQQFLAAPEPNADVIQMIVEQTDATITDRPIFHLGDIELNVRTVANLDLLVFGSDGTLLAISDRSFMPLARRGQGLTEQRLAGLSDPLRTAFLDETGPLQLALAGESDPDHLFAIIEPNERFLFAVPIFAGDSTSPVLGVLVINFRSLPTETDLSSHALIAAGKSLLLFLIGAGILGALFGTLTANGMVQRFRRLSVASTAWSQGDFSEYIDDPTGDELSQLTQRLNGMAQQLQILLQTRQKIAVAEERNRLARDLHDSAKQQAFAASAQLAAALTQFDQDPPAAKAHMQEADKLVNQVRKELTNLILELRPVDLSRGSLGAALQSYAVDWAHQHDIEVDVNVVAERPLPLPVEETIFRIAQEALANIARHSQADGASVALVYGEDGVTLTVEDDGAGFDADSVQKGMGLTSMQERAELVNGAFMVERINGSGTRVSLTLPGTAPGPEAVPAQEIHHA